ncbi:hypothetical protein [Pseudophaeobacter sp.]|uniref:YncE family protein n=1 Tax=Pseudophaeobacter sp. TaxID=1971739 RepID=UPI003298C564
MTTRRETLVFLASAICAAGPAHAGWFSGKPDLRDAERYAFVPSRTALAIAVVDLHQAKLAATIELPHVAADIIVSQMLGMVFATNPDQGTLTPVMLKTQEVGPAFEVGLRPDHALLGFEDQFAAFWSNDGDLIVWDLKNIRPIYQNSRFQPGAQISFSGNGRGLYVVEGLHNQMITVDLEENKIAKIVPLHLDAPTDRISAVTRSMDGGRGFISVADQDKLLLLNLKDPAFMRAMPIEGEPMRPYSTGDGRFTIIPNRASKAITVLDANTYTVLRRIPLEITPTEFNTGWFDTIGFAMSETEALIDVLDLERLERRGEIALPEVGDRGVVSADMRTLAVAMPEAGGVALIDAPRGVMETVVGTDTPDISGVRLGVSNNICH